MCTYGRSQGRQLYLAIQVCNSCRKGRVGNKPGGSGDCPAIRSYLNQRVCKITTKESILNQKFLYYYLPYELEEIFKTVSYVTVKHLSDKHFRTMRIPLPPLAEQHRIVEKLEQLLGKIYKLKK
jgi:restriction endonuclease S subunit